MKKITKIALIAHDGKKQEIVSWVLNNKEILKNYKLCGTGTTAKRVEEATSLKVEGLLSGPLAVLLHTSDLEATYLDEKRN